MIQTSPDKVIVSLISTQMQVRFRSVEELTESSSLEAIPGTKLKPFWFGFYSWSTTSLCE